MKHRITIVGLGAGDLNQLPFGIYKRLMNAEHLFLRTKEHPVIYELEQEGLVYKSYDHIYEGNDQFLDVYEEIVARLIEEARTKDIIFAVPGHPFVAEKTVQLLISKEKDSHFLVEVEGGQSFIDPLFTSLQVDPIEGFQFLDGLTFEYDELQLTQHIIICQVYDGMVASHVKLTLMEQLPDDYEVFIVTAVGSKDEVINKVPLYELDRGIELSNLTSIYVPPVKDTNVLSHDFRTFKKVIASLRGPGGCPWDQKQTHESLKKYLLEEAYELLEAIDNEDDAHMVEELGDVLLQVVLHAQIGEDEGYFSINDVIKTVTEKMIRRHPHVFSDVIAEDADAVVKNWEEIKKGEKGEQKAESILDHVPKSFTGLMKAFKYQKIAGKVGFDWQEIDPMWAKVKEEIEEFKEAIQGKHEDQKKRMISEFGDILFALVNVARFYEIDPEEAIIMTNDKFYRRFLYIEQKVQSMEKEMENMTLDELDGIWNEAKQKGL
ncbi:bifunctional methyltransferase/pyrophosphohydrolase YabN [Litchfieldia salsa]|uniref:Tetrapyrrole methylase family protein / MazG family protein n=1 Tax=Litchfieldia salsa TaxID=930152 RepID=A0A1H0WZB8_9BACI|nr:nucleoside triphosphate pyrophosphohydrolase [Litchfieldia salsa]SDP96002.1 tetrapyrrole methylase family protein / MazG family protein [Litchfieldia salsa]